MKKVHSIQTIVERAVVASIANCRSKGHRNAKMIEFATRYGNYTTPTHEMDLERECTRIIRSLGGKYARHLLTWFVGVKNNIDNKRYPAFVPIQPSFDEMKEAA